MLGQSIEETFESIGCSAYVLLNGEISYLENNYTLATNHSLRYPYILITNCSTYANFSYHNFTSELRGIDIRDSFSNGFISICYIVSAVTVASWSSVLLLVLSTSPKSKISSLLTLVYSILISIILSKTTDLLDSQFIANYQDAGVFKNNVLHNPVTYGLGMVVKLLTILAWGEFLQTIYILRWKKIIDIFTGVAFIALLIFNTLLITANDERSKLKSFYDIMVIIIDLTVYTIFAFSFYTYVSIKAKYAFTKHVIASTIFTMLLTLGPFIFYLTFVVSNNIDNWATTISQFFPVLITILIWELYYKILKVEKYQEMKTILGRQINNEEVPGRKFKRDNLVTKRSFHMNYFKNPLVNEDKRRPGRILPNDINNSENFDDEDNNDSDVDDDNNDNNNENLLKKKKNHHNRWKKKRVLQTHHLTEIQLSTPIGNNSINDNNVNGSTPSTIN